MRRFEFLEAGVTEDGAKLCGRDTVQVRLGSPLDLDVLAKRLAGVDGTVGDAKAARVERSRFMVRVVDGVITLTCFADGRVLVAGVKDVAAGRGAVAKWVGV
jgi:adenylyltransferase/sulfurtransferase